MIKFDSINILIRMLLFCLLLIPPYITIKISSFPGMNPERLIEFLLVFIFIIFYIYSKNFRINIKQYTKEYKLLFLLIFTLYGIQVLSSILFAINPISSVANSVIKFIGQALLLLIVVSFMNKEKVYKAIKYILILQSVIIFLGLIEYIKGGTLFGFFAFLNENIREDFISGNFRDNTYRIISTMPHSLVLAQLIVILLPFNHFYLKNKYLKLIPIVNIVLSPIIIILTDSRMGIGIYILFYFLYFASTFMKLVFTTRIYFFIKKSIYKISILIFLISTFIFIQKFQTIINYGDNYILENMKNTNSASTNSTLARIIQLKIASENISFLGYGSKGVINIIEKSPLEAMDNYYISLILNVGIIGLMIFFFILFKIYNLIIKNSHNHFTKPFLFFYLNFSIFILILSIDYLMSLFFIFLGFLFIVLRKEDN